MDIEKTRLPICWLTRVMSLNVKKIILDTETTGLDPKAGHRVIEIGCVELVNRKFDEQFHLLKSR